MTLQGLWAQVLPEEEKGADTTVTAGHLKHRTYLLLLQKARTNHRQKSYPLPAESLLKQGSCHRRTVHWHFCMHQKQTQ